MALLQTFLPSPLRSFPRKLSGAWRLISLEPGTCCDRAATLFAEHAFETLPERVVVPSFAAGIQRAQGNPREIVLLPHVHETCSALTTRAGWEMLTELAFPLENPPLLLARRPGTRPISGSAERCATIERLKPLLDGAEAGELRFEIVQTTQDAARACAAESGPELCITNQHGRDHYGLETVKHLKHMTIWWMPFHQPTELEKPMSENVSVLIINQSIGEIGILVNAAFVLGLTAGRCLPDDSFGADTVDGDGNRHRYLTRIGHHVRKASAGKLRTLRETFLTMPSVQVVDYTEDAAPADYHTYTEALASHRGEDLNYRAIHIYGPPETVIPLTKNLSRL